MCLLCAILLCNRRDQQMLLCRAVPATFFQYMQHKLLRHTERMRGPLGHRRFTTSTFLGNLALGACNTGCTAMHTFNYIGLFNYFAHSLCCCVVLFFTVFCRVEAITYINSDITVNTVWTKSGSPYVYALICCFWFRFACWVLCFSMFLWRSRTIDGCLCSVIALLLTLISVVV